MIGISRVHHNETNEVVDGQLTKLTVFLPFISETMLVTISVLGVFAGYALLYDQLLSRLLLTDMNRLNE